MREVELNKFKIEYADTRFKSDQEVQEYFNQDRLPCLLCGKTFKLLGKHLLRAHDMSGDEYKEIFNIPWGQALACPSTRAIQSENLIRRLADGSMPKTDPKVLVELHRNKPKRRVRDYHLARLDGMIDTAATKRRLESKEKVLHILAVMEENRCTIYKAFHILGLTNCALVKRTIAYFPELQARYDEVCSKIQKPIERKSKMSLDELREQIFFLRQTNLTNNEIAEKLNISKNTLQRALKKEGSFVKCKDTVLEDTPIKVSSSGHRIPKNRKKIVRKAPVFESSHEERVAALKLEFQSKRFKSRQEAKDYVSTDKIKCLICGEEFELLASHLTCIHGINTDDYKDIFGIPWRVGLVGADVHRRQSEAAIKRVAKHPDNIKKAYTTPRDIHAKKRTQVYKVYQKSEGESDYIRNHKAKTWQAATEILDAMEKYLLPATVVCELPGMTGIHALNNARKYFPDIRERYDKIKLILKNLKARTNHKNLENN